jgi:peroxiredoxin
MSGIKENDTILIVDENNNKDFRDDSVRVIKSLRQLPTNGWWSNSTHIKSKYFISDGNELIEDSTWVCIAKIYNEGLLFFVSHHLEATFSVDDQVYKIGIIDRYTNFCFDDPTMTLLTRDGIRRDTLTESELIKQGEYLKLKDKYYRFDTISNDGRYVTLIKEKEFNNKIGTQVGMIAPDFNCHSIDGDSISSSNYKGKYLILVNVSACWSRISSYQCYKIMTETYKGKLEFIAIDNSPATLRNNIKALNLSGEFVIAEENKMIQKAYRPDYSSRTCFLIDPDGRILDKFEIFDWRTNLSHVFEN